MSLITTVFNLHACRPPYGITHAQCFFTTLGLRLFSPFSKTHLSWIATSTAFGADSGFNRIIGFRSSVFEPRESFLSLDGSGSESHLSLCFAKIYYSPPLGVELLPFCDNLMSAAESSYHLLTFTFIQF